MSALFPLYLCGRNAAEWVICMKKKITPIMIVFGLGIITGVVLNFLGVFVIGGALIGGCTAGLIATIKNRPQQEDKEK